VRKRCGRSRKKYARGIIIFSIKMVNVQVFLSSFDNKTLIRWENVIFSKEKYKLNMKALIGVNIRYK
jgi:hypothetical protein